MRSINWEKCFKSNDLSEVFDSFYSELSGAVDSHIPLKTYCKFIPPKWNLHSDFGKRLYTCNSIYVNPRNEIEKGVPHTTFRDREAKFLPSGAIYFVKESHVT